MSGRGPGLQELATQIAFALAEALLPVASDQGPAFVSLDNAHVFASGRVDLWDGWAKQPAQVRQLVGRFLRVRNNELGSYRRFVRSARDVASRPNCPYGIATGQSWWQVSHVVPRHGQDPLELAERLTAEAEARLLRTRQPLPLATAGRWTFGSRSQSTIELPATITQADAEPLTLTTAPHLDDVRASRKELTGLADQLDRARGGKLWQAPLIENLFEGLKDGDSIPIGTLLLRAGRLELLNAPTGVGKSVLMRLLAVLLASRGIKVGIVVGTIDEAQNTADGIAAQAAAVESAASEIREDLALLGRPLRVATLISVRRLHEKAMHAAQRGNWARFDALAYGCTIPAWLVDGPAPRPGEEPCTGLRPAGETVPATRDQPQRHACPRLSSCDRHRGIREALDADIIVTNHHNLMHGANPVPLAIDGDPVARTSVLNLMQRRCQVLLIDEVDRFQSNMFDTGARQLLLAANTGLTDLPLGQLNRQRSLLLPREDRVVLPALSRTTFLAEQFLNYCLEGDIWLSSDYAKRGRADAENTGWHLPGSNDRLLLHFLFGVQDPRADVPRKTYAQFNALFPDSEDRNDVVLPRNLAGIAALLEDLVSNDKGLDVIRQVKHELHQATNPLVRKQITKDALISKPDTAVLAGAKKDRKHKDPAPDEIHREVVNALIVRTWLGALHQSLTSLTFAVGSPDAGLPAARALVDQLGTFVQHAVIPYGPLGYLLFGFRIDRVDDGAPRGQLSVQAIAGDPHSTTAQLGGTVALATAGTERIVLGLSATAYFPRAAREHIMVAPSYAMTDAKPGAFRTVGGQVTLDGGAISVGGQREDRKADVLHDLGRMLWDQQLDPHLRRLAETEPERERCLVVGNSYHHAAVLGAGIGSHVADPSWMAVVIPKGQTAAGMRLPRNVVALTIDELEDLPRNHPNVKVCAAPLGLVARGLNILVPGTQQSALASIWVCVRPVLQISAPAEILASVNAHALSHGEPGPDPAAVLDSQRKAGFGRLFTLLAADPRFSRLPRFLKAETIAGMLVDLIQLAGRARRGGTSVSLHLVDNAFHDAALGNDLPSLLRYYYENLTPGEQRDLDRIYGSTLTSWLDFAGINYVHLNQENL